MAVPGTGTPFFAKVPGASQDLCHTYLEWFRTGFLRTRRGVGLSAEGQAYYDEIAPAFVRIAAATSRLDGGRPKNL